MSCSQLSVVKHLLTESQFFALEQYLSSLSPNCKLTASKISLANGIDLELTQKVLQKLVEGGIFKYSFGLRCPFCGLLLGTENELPAIEKEQYCYQCDESVEITPDNVEIIYTFDVYPFGEGQQNKRIIEPEESAAHSFDSLARLIENGILDLNAEFFSPTSQEYHELQAAYNNVFAKKNTTKEKGDSLEALVLQLFSLCRYFRAAPIRLRPNQIDCYVRNKLYIPGLSPASCTDSFVIECKNEKKTPSATYMNKLHSILRSTGKQFGIIVSKCPAPSTFLPLSNKIYLNDKIVIIALDADDLKQIIFNKVNLLECLSEKIDAVKLNATKDLKTLGLYYE